MIVVFSYLICYSEKNEGKLFFFNQTFLLTPFFLIYIYIELSSSPSSQNRNYDAMVGRSRHEKLAPPAALVQNCFPTLKNQCRTERQKGSIINKNNVSVNMSVSTCKFALRVV